MKKTKSLLMLVLSIMMCSCLLTGCKNDDNKIPIISFKNDFEVIEKYYYVGDNIELNGQCIDYYSHIADSQPAESDIPVTLDMVSNFNTQVAGEYTFKITYNKTSKEVYYYVYDKVDVSSCYGLYTSVAFGRNATIEIKADKVCLNTYEEGVTDFKNNQPISTIEIDSNLKANVNGKPSIEFVYEQYKYEFCEFVNNIPTRIKKSSLSESGYSSITLMCSKLD